MAKQYHFYLIAGEPSGDNLGAKLMQALKKECGQKNITFSGIGGEQMQQQGLTSLFPMHELSIMGFIEILPHIFKLVWRIFQTIRDIRKKQPDMLITIDSPGFNYRIAKALRKTNIKLVHYVAPTVWAYRPKRAKKIAAIYDHLLVLLPFEPPYFEKEELPTSFVGHPIVEDDFPNANEFRDKYGISSDRQILCMMPGSREGEVRMLLPIFAEVLERIAAKKPDIMVAIPTLPSFAKIIESYLEDIPLQTIIIENKAEKLAAFATSDVALVKSGTGTVELAFANVPMVVAYKVKPFTYWMMKKMIQVPYVSIVNLLLNKQLVPECLQDDCTADCLTNHLLPLLDDTPKRKTQQKGFIQALEKLGMGKEIPPSQKAAKELLKLFD